MEKGCAWDSILGHCSYWENSPKLFMTQKFGKGLAYRWWENDDLSSLSKHVIEESTRYTCIYPGHILPVCAVWGEPPEVNINQLRMPYESSASLEL